MCHMSIMLLAFSIKAGMYQNAIKEKLFQSKLNGDIQLKTQVWNHKIYWKFLSVLEEMFQLLMEELL